MGRYVSLGYLNPGRILDLDKAYFMKVSLCSIHLHMVPRMFLCRIQSVDGTVTWGIQGELELVA
jgi:hypothetical protein